jgi:hypothetical protein
MFFQKYFAREFFKSDDAGQRVFYPLGRFGAGYIVDAMAEKEIQTSYRKQMYWFTGLLVVQIGLQSIIGIDKTLIILAGPWLLMLLVHYVWLRRRTRGLPISTMRMTTSDLVSSRAQSYSALRAYGVLGAVVVMTLGSVFVALHEHGLSAWIGAYGVMYFGYRSVRAIRVIRAMRGAS